MYTTCAQTKDGQIKALPGLEVSNNKLHDTAVV